MEKNQNKNPLLALSSLDHRAIAFDQIHLEHFMPALDSAIQQQLEAVARISTNPDAPNFKNTIEALEISGELVNHVVTVFSNRELTLADTEVQNMAQVFWPKVSQLSNDIRLNADLFTRINTVFNNRNDNSLSTEENQLVETTYRSFKRNGALLSDSDKQSLRDIDDQLSKINPKFGENVLKATNKFKLYLDKEQTAGLPESAIEAASEAAKTEGENSKYLFTLNYPSYVPLITYLDDRSIRETAYKASASRAFKGELDNQQNVIDMVNLRHKRAQLLGYKSHANFILEEQMAQTPETVFTFLDKLFLKSKPAAEKDVQEVQDFALSIGGPEQIMPWDFAYYSEKLKQKKFDFNEEDLRPYFGLENVLQGAFEHAKKLFNIEFKLSEKYPKYHPEVSVYEVYELDTNAFVGLFYLDYFPRDSKSGGAWMSNYYEQGLYADEVMRPHVTNVCNFTKPTATKPSLLTYNEVRTLFHEFGHGLHGLLSKCKYRSLSGTNVFRDFVELPSQVLENWTLEPESLNIFAKHYETNEPIPKELAEKLIASSKFQAGYASLRQLCFAYLDMKYHSEDPKFLQEVSDFEKNATEKCLVLPSVDGTNFSVAFSHIFNGGYSSGYYSYKWAEVLDADAFELFKEKGLFDSQTGKSFKENILEKGGSEHPMDLYLKFRGRKPDPEALLRRDGLV